ncbi:MAG: iron-containing redox enzyme family protein [Agitococcus sp.]|nr:iron-containing redox enzyme family protein [Agitococcus sp.]
MTTMKTEQLHRTLAHFNSKRLLPSMATNDWQDDLATELEFKLLEGQFLEELRQDVAPQIALNITDANAFITWFESLQVNGFGQHHPLFDWLATTATNQQMCWFLTQEVAGEAGFDDLVAYTQVKLPVRAKLECARNYWDEMGRGKQGAMHGLLLERMVQLLALKPDINNTVWPALALNNTMIGLALNRRFAYQAVGALGVIELTAPTRAAKVAAGMKRLGFHPHTYAYFDLHAALDVIHARAWLDEVIKPMVEDNPSCAPLIAEGALMRLRCGLDCFDRYAHELSAHFTTETD